MANQKMRPPDIEYIKAHFGQMSERQLADAIGVSKSTVHRAIKRLGLTLGGACPQPPERAIPQAGEQPAERVVRLRSLARLLEAAMREAPSTSLAALSKEYRAALDEIDGIERAEKPAEEKRPEAKVTKFGAIRARKPATGEAAQDQGRAVG